MTNNQIINNAVDFIKEKVAPEKIYLFGSYAKGIADSNSDLDFFIIQNTALPKHERVKPLYSLDKSKRIGELIGIDFIIYSPDEFEAQRNEMNSIVAEVLRTGKLLESK